MSTVLPQGESLRKAVKWVSEALENNAGADLFSLVNDAILRFDLSPKDGQFLYRFYQLEKSDQ